MTRFRRLLLTVATTLVLVGVAAPVGAESALLATEETQAPAASTTVVEYTGPDAYIPVEEPAPDTTEPAWTYKFLIPGTLVLIAVMVLALVVGYFVRVVRTRYTVVE